MSVVPVFKDMWVCRQTLHPFLVDKPSVFPGVHQFVVNQAEFGAF